MLIMQTKANQDGNYFGISFHFGRFMELQRFSLII
jgi:hypothetical protein